MLMRQRSLSLALQPEPIRRAIDDLVHERDVIDAGRAGWGSLLGNVGAMVAKLIIALAMISIFLINVPLPF